jgi:uncharacterized membrane protein
MKKAPKAKNDLLPRPPIIVAILALMALLLSGYLAWTSWQQSKLLGCGGEGGANCEEVISTRWGKWFGIPIGAGGVIVYGAIFFVSFSMRKQASLKQWLMLIFFAALASASALWFIGLQIIEIKSYCYYCMAVHACGLAIAAIVLTKAPFKRLNARHALTAIVAAVASVAVIAAGQLYAGKDSDYQPPSVTEPVQNQAQTSPPKEMAVREVILDKGKIWFSLSDFPFVGSGNTTNFVAHFFDYTCPACRQFHSTLRSAHENYVNETTLVMIPVPLDAACNPAVKETAYVHQNACEYAKIGLALWRTSPQSYESYDQFIFHEQIPPSIDAARELADHLAGKDAMDRALADSEVTTILNKGLGMFYSPAFQQKAIPALVTKNEVITGFPAPQLLNSLLAGR